MQPPSGERRTQGAAQESLRVQWGEVVREAVVEAYLLRVATENTIAHGLAFVGASKAAESRDIIKVVAVPSTCGQCVDQVVLIFDEFQKKRTEHSTWCLLCPHLTYRLALGWCALLQDRQHRRVPLLQVRDCHEAVSVARQRACITNRRRTI